MKKVWKKLVVFIFFESRKKWIYPKALASLAPFYRGVLWYYKSMAYIRKFKTGSGKTGVQVCYKREGKVVKTVHVGSAETEAGVRRLLREAQEVIDAGKKSLFDLDKF